MRIYLPATVADLATLATSGSLAISRGFVVTEGLAAAYGPGEDEEYEHCAMSGAAAASRAAQGSPWRRVVLAAEVDPDQVGQLDVEHEIGEVRLLAPLDLAAIAAIHLDELWRTEELTDDDAADLQWFATQELDALVKGEQS